VNAGTGPSTTVGRQQEESGADDRPALSVIALTYNSASVIEDCLDSLVEHDFTDFEDILSGAVAFVQPDRAPQRAREKDTATP
jgi:GT2 family glycosyltransferase